MMINLILTSNKYYTQYITLFDLSHHIIVPGKAHRNS
jgi:hypothetical protein